MHQSSCRLGQSRMADSYAKVLSAPTVATGAARSVQALAAPSPPPDRQDAQSRVRRKAAHRSATAKPPFTARLRSGPCGAAKAFVNPNKHDDFHAAETILVKAPSPFVLIGLNDLIAAPVASFSGWRCK